MYQYQYFSEEQTTQWPKEKSTKGQPSTKQKIPVN
jgi:hypothetical protein